MQLSKKEVKIIIRSIILIPAYEPDKKLNKLIDDLEELSFSNIVIVNDGSSDKCVEIFKEIEKNPHCTLITHETNKGKGIALKTGMKTIMSKFKNAKGCITVDADGQHLASDILKIDEVFEKNKNSLILGCRTFDDEKVPFRSKMGNLLTRLIFKLLTGKYISDTQTGLRAIPNGYMDKFLNLPGERYELEINMLIEAAKDNMDIKEVPIETVYIANNISSHFNPLLDSFKIYLEIFKFAFSSLLCSIIDIGLYSIFHGLFSTMRTFNPVFLATCSARIISSSVNFALNKNVVFTNKDPANSQAIKYALLVLGQMMCSYLLVQFIMSIGIKQVVLSKILADTVLFIISYFIQHFLIFKKDIPKRNISQN